MHVRRSRDLTTTTKKIFQPSAKKYQISQREADGISLMRRKTTETHGNWKKAGLEKNRRVVDLSNNFATNMT